MLKLLIFELLGLWAVVARYDYSKLVPMDDYDKEYRVLSCWECFSANGKMCSYVDNRSMYYLTRSSNPGHGICCKPDSNVRLC